MLVWPALPGQNQGGGVHPPGLAHADGSLSELGGQVSDTEGTQIADYARRWWFLGEWLDYKGRWRNYRITPICEPDRRMLEVGYRAWRGEQSDGLEGGK